MTIESVAPLRALTETETEALHGIGEGPQSQEVPRTGSPPQPMTNTRGIAPLAPETFSYCVGRPWPVDYANPYETNINVYAYFGQVHHGTMADAESFLGYVDEKTSEKNQIYKLVPVISTVNDKGETVELLSPEQSLRALVEALEVNMPDYGLFEGKRKMVLWSTDFLGSEGRMCLCIAENYMQEASLNHLWGVFNQARRTLGIPETHPPSAKES